MKKILIVLLALGSISIFAQTEIKTVSHANSFSFNTKEQLRSIVYRIELGKEICTNLRFYIHSTDNIKISERLYNGDKLKTHLDNSRETARYILGTDGCNGQDKYFGNIIDERLFTQYSDDIYLLEYFEL